MISLKKYLEQKPDELLHCALDSYRSAVSSIGTYGRMSCPATGSDLRQNLTAIAQHFSKEATCPVIKETREQVEEQLQQWGSRTEEYFQQKTNEVKELLIVLAARLNRWANGMRNTRRSSPSSHRACKP